MFGYVYILTLLSISFSVNSHEESSPCVFSFMENVLEKMLTMRTKMAEMERKMTEMENRLADDTRSSNNPVVAFRIMLTSTLASVSSRTLLKFNKVDFNLGNAYSHGVFIAPYNGTYEFSTTLGNPPNEPGELFLKKNGIGVEFNIAGHTAGFNVGGVTTVMKLTAGDRVWVEGKGRITGAFDTPGYYTSFSGFLIHTI